MLRKEKEIDTHVINSLHIHIFKIIIKAMIF